MRWDLHHSPSAEVVGGMNTAHESDARSHSGRCDVQKTKASDSSHHDARIGLGRLLADGWKFWARPPNEYASVKLQKVTLGVQFGWVDLG